MDINNKNEDTTSIKLIYEYTEAYLKAVEDSLKSLNTRCAGLIGFAGALIKPFFDLPHCQNHDLIRVLALLLILLAIFCGIIGLLTAPSGDVVTPKELYDDWYFETEERCRGFIVTKSWLIAIDQLTQKGLFKGQCFNVGAICFALAILLSAVSAFPSLIETASIPHVTCTKP